MSVIKTTSTDFYLLCLGEQLCSRAAIMDVMHTACISTLHVVLPYMGSNIGVGWSCSFPLGMHVQRVTVVVLIEFAFL